MAKFEYTLRKDLLEKRVTEKKEKNGWRRIWIVWERHRRSIELSKKVGAKLYIFDIKGWKRYPLSIFYTVTVLLKYMPAELFVQNPSMILATLACLYGKVFSKKVIVDRHTTFRLKKPHSGSLRIWLFMRLHYLTMKWADLTIVTNEYLAGIVRAAKGRSFVLPDILPNIKPQSKRELKGETNILLISSFGNDEPIKAVLEAMRSISPETVLYITGNYKKLDPEVVKNAASHVVFTGFIPDADFVDLLYSVDAAMALTTSDYCMLCGCYEAVAAAKPLITSDKSVLKDYFNLATFVNNTSEDIAKKIIEVTNFKEYKQLRSEMMRAEISDKWNSKFSEFESLMARWHTI